VKNTGHKDQKRGFHWKEPNSSIKAVSERIVPQEITKVF